MRRTGELLVLLSLLLIACTGIHGPLELTTRDPAHDQALVAKYLDEEAQTLLRKSAELRARALIYEALFGPDSEWAVGARVLARFYEQSAADREHEAQMHRDLAVSR